MMDFINDRKEEWLYYHDDLPDYERIYEAYSLWKDYIGDDKYRIHLDRTERTSFGYSLGGVQDKELFNQAVNLTKDNNKYSYFLENVVNC